MRRVVSRLNQEHLSGTFRKIQSQGMPKTSAKVDKHRRARKKDKIPIDTASEKRPRGRPIKIQASWVRGRADNYRDNIFDLIWDHVWPGLSKAETRQDVVQSFSGAEVGAYATDLVILADLILQVVRDPKFPKRKREAQINFMADSIAAHGVVTPRSSRDICDRERARIKRVRHILRYEYYVECSCGYKGQSRDHACPNCEAQIELRGGFDV
jgi:hypothetical protein